MLKIWLLLFPFLMVSYLFAQNEEKAVIKLLGAEEMKFDESIGEETFIYVGNVSFEHEQAYLYCDSAVLNAQENIVDCYGNVHIITPDKIDLYGDTLNYNGQSKIGEIYGRVELQDKKMTLYSDKLIYNRNTSTAFYPDYSKIVDEENTLTSRQGTYFIKTKELFFKDSVELVNEKYIMNSDTLKYNTKTDIAYFYGPTTIVSDSNTIYCQYGWYNTETDQSQFSKNAVLSNSKQDITAKNLYYDRKLGFGKAQGNVIMNDTTQNITVTGEYAEYYEIQEKAFFTDSALAMLKEKEDTLFLHADTLLVHFNGAKDSSVVFAYYGVRFYKSDMQGMCDSLVYSNPDSTIYMYRDIAIWAEESQFSADSVHIKLKNEQIDKVFMYNQAFVLSKDTLEYYHQIRGKTMVGFFQNNELVRLDVDKNAESLYFIREENRSLIGLNHTESSEIQVFLKDSEFKKIKYINEPESKTFPEHEINNENSKLKGYNNRFSIRPKDKTEVF